MKEDVQFLCASVYLSESIKALKKAFYHDQSVTEKLKVVMAFQISLDANY